MIIKRVYHNENAKQPFDVKVYDYAEITPEIVNFEVERIAVKGGKYHKAYYNLYMSFDIETTTLVEKTADGSLLSANAYMYVWQCGLNDIVIIGRTWEEWVGLLDLIKNTYKLNSGTRVICWIANLSFETQFMRHWVNITDQFSKEARQPLYIVHDDCIEFRDALPIAGGSLKKLAEMYTNTQKCKGDLDYSLPRNFETPLTDTEQGYIYNDVIILTEFSKVIFDKYIRNKFVPMTKTQMIINEMKEKAYAQYGKKKFHNMISCKFPSKPMYDILMNYCFRGGYVHGNMLYIGKVFDESDDIGSWDYTSDYPAIMSQCYLCDKLKPVYNLTWEYLNDLMTNDCVIMCLTFDNIERTTWHSIESAHKCVDLVNPILDNGRVSSADRMTVIITELDFDTYKFFYRWANVRVHWALHGKRVKMPRYVMEVVEKYYTSKEYLKSNGLPYAIEKSFVNISYGAAVKRFSNSLVTYVDGEWGVDNTGDTFEKQRDSAVMLPQYGIYITAAARHRILSTIEAMSKVPGGDPNDALYIDTDSIKVQHQSKYFSIFDKYNKETEHINWLNCQKYNLDFKVFHDLGCFDYEYKSGVRRLKYLGAKRYVRDYYKGGYKVTEVTCAGVPKGVINEYAESNGVDIYDIFADGLKLDNAHKLATKYNDHPHSEEVTDYLGHTVTMSERSSVGLYETSFELTVDKAWKNNIIAFWAQYGMERFRI